MKESRFIIRVYGIYFDLLNGLLVSDEIVKGKKITKFPGGGLEYGEGTIDCLLREMDEETGHKFIVQSHFYTTDFFVESVFDSNRQIISIYYFMKPLDKLNLASQANQIDFQNNIEGTQLFRFMQKEKINPEQFTLVIDRHVASLLEEYYK